MNNTITFYNGTKLPDPVMTISSTGITVNPNIEVDEISKTVLTALDESIKRMVQMAVEAEREECAEHYLSIMRKAVQAARNDEREACAQVCDAHASIEGIAQQCAAEIRARKEMQ